MTGFALVGWEGELLVLFGVPTSTSAHSAGVEDKGAHCLLALGECQHKDQDCNKILKSVLSGYLHSTASPGKK